MKLSLSLLVFFLLLIQTANAGFKCSKQEKFVAKRVQSQSTIDHHIDVLYYNITLDFTEKSQSRISGNATVKGILSSDSEIRLDLLGLIVDSVKIGNTSPAYTHASDSLKITLPSTYAAGDTIELQVYYQGNPVTDASGWGGFYFTGNYAFNLGVGFAANPHNYGRVWFPCVDNFTDRAIYEFNITTLSSDKAICNGLLLNETDNGNGTITWNWKLHQSIPTYLASVAVGPYEMISYQHAAQSNSLPVILAGEATDTADLMQSFRNLPDAIDIFENTFGNYQWDRVGFVLVPFNAGAMEHATNIAYPRNSADGTLNSEDLMIHEFCHHWWGDLLTCSSAEDMWINEGWASYTPILFREMFYGAAAGKTAFRSNHREVLQYAHIRDDGYKAISGISHNYTYGDHVYNKGADVAYTLRSYLKADFFPCLTQLMNDRAFTDINSESFRDYLSNCSGINLDNFFENWVFNPGFPHFSIDSFAVIESGNAYSTTIVIRQKNKEAPALFENVPLELEIGNANNSVMKEVYMKGSCGTFTVETAFEPAYVLTDPLQKTADATTDYISTLDSTGLYNFNDAVSELELSNTNANNRIQITKHWVAPDPWPNAPADLHLSIENYWSVKGYLENNTEGTLKLFYNGSTSGNYAHLDKALISSSEDDLVLLYRKNAAHTWAIEDSFIVNVLNPNDKRGSITTPFKLGEFALAINDPQKNDSTIYYLTAPCQELSTTLSGEEQKGEDRSFKVYPNPSKGKFHIDLRSLQKEEIENIKVYNLKGEKVWDKNHPKLLETVTTENWPATFYFVHVNYAGQQASQKILIH